MQSLGVLAFFTRVYHCFKRRETDASNKMTNQTSSKYDDGDDDDSFHKEGERLGKRSGGSDIELTSAPFINLKDKTSHDEFNPKSIPTPQNTVKQFSHVNVKKGEVSLSNHDINNNDIISSSPTVVSNDPGNDDNSESCSVVEVPFIIRKSAQEESDVFSDLALKHIEAHDDEASL